MRRVELLIVALFIGANASALGAACSDDERAGLPNTIRDDDVDDLVDLTPDPGPPDPDAGGLCGNQIHQAVANAPNIYFVLDASGSMADYASGGTRLSAVRSAIVGVLRSLGPLINAGLALFPKDATVEEPCRPGNQVLPVRPGDPKTGEDGATTKAFLQATLLDPFGGTPTAATLFNLVPTLSELEGRTIVVVATDGAPNCNFAATCGESECTPNIEGVCDPGTNCCDPDEFGPVACIDRAQSIEAVAEIADLGIDVYVIGIPGSEEYASVLDQMAIVGGAPRPNPPFYYAVDDLDALEEVLGGIASVVVSCEFDLSDPPEDQGFTNVYLDSELLTADPANGWGWKSDSTIELHGEACARLKNGDVAQVQIVSGCPTEGPK